MTEGTGRVGVVMPHGVLFRGGAEAKIRQCLIEQDRLEAVIGLPPNLFYSTSIPACILDLPRDEARGAPQPCPVRRRLGPVRQGQEPEPHERRRHGRHRSRPTRPAMTPTARAASTSVSCPSTRSRPTASTSTSAATSRPPPPTPLDLPTALANYEDAASRATRRGAGTVRRDLRAARISRSPMSDAWIETTLGDGRQHATGSATRDDSRQDDDWRGPSARSRHEATVPLGETASTDSSRSSMSARPSSSRWLRCLMLHVGTIGRAADLAVPIAAERGHRLASKPIRDQRAGSCTCASSRSGPG